MLLGCYPSLDTFMTTTFYSLSALYKLVGVYDVAFDGKQIYGTATYLTHFGPRVLLLKKLRNWSKLSSKISASSWVHAK